MWAQPQSSTFSVHISPNSDTRALKGHHFKFGEIGFKRQRRSEDREIQMARASERKYRTAPESTKDENGKETDRGW
jgi:hypothetical protein